LLYQIDPAPFQAALDKAQANLAAVQSRAKRVAGLLADKVVSQQDFDDADAALKQALADLETARINLAYTKITAPIAGRIGKSSVTDGAIVTAYQPVPLATIQQLDPVYVDVPQSTADLLRLERRLADGRLSRDGNNQNVVRLILEDGTQYPQEGTLQFRDVSVDPTTATVILRMVFPNPNGVLLPGMFVRTVVKEGVNDHAILIPQQAVIRDSMGNPLALLVNAASTVEPRLLTLDRAIGDKWLVTSGLAPGDRVIVEGLMKVRPGAAVKAVDLAAKANPATPPAPTH
jgi:membrane fusion protein, multidrug efflux system